MLGKLIKYELKATARTLMPLYIALLAFALINRLFMGSSNNMNSDLLGGIPMMLSIFAYAFTMAAVFIITFFVIVQRFYKNLLGDEGYLMNTLPVKAWMNISSKLVTSIIWSIVSGIVAILSIIIMAFSQDILTNLFSGINNLTSYLSQGYFGVAVELILYGFVSMISSTLMLYLSISIGHLFNKRRIFASFGSFIVINMIISAIKGTMQGSVYQGSVYIGNNSGIIPKTNGLLVFDLILAIVFFVACNYIIKNKLNLE
ncbi:ABC transporter permease [Clostridium sp.]|uniref:ABC transporter permease n=1 Tax=Clostridium sp. TaxID=1506 RepID=UPI0026196D7B|nr:ABC transporter permease [Clostridium sp.]